MCLRNVRRGRGSEKKQKRLEGGKRSTYDVLLWSKKKKKTYHFEHSLKPAMDSEF